MKKCIVSFTVLLMLVIGGCSFEDDSQNNRIDDRLSDEQLANLPVPAATENEFIFGFDLRSSPQEDARQYLPFLKYLESATGYKFKLRFTPKDGKIIDDLGEGVVDFAAIGAVSFIQANLKYGAVPMVRGLNESNIAKYRSMIVVKPNSPIRNIKALKGKRLAFGSLTSTQGHLIPRILLSKAGLVLSDLDSYDYTGSHQKCADAVISGLFDACGLQDVMALNLKKRGLVRILVISDYYPSSGIAAYKGVPQEVLKNIRKAMLDFDPKGKDSGGLYHWEKTEMPNGFVAARENDYEELKLWLNKLDLVDHSPQLKTRLGKLF